jgi:hypothetical protein
MGPAPVERFEMEHSHPTPIRIHTGSSVLELANQLQNPRRCGREAWKHTNCESIASSLDDELVSVIVPADAFAQF